jgi:hypothetical protein
MQSSVIGRTLFVSGVEIISTVEPGYLRLSFDRYVDSM